MLISGRPFLGGVRSEQPVCEPAKVSELGEVVEPGDQQAGVDHPRHPGGVGHSGRHRRTRYVLDVPRGQAPPVLGDEDDPVRVGPASWIMARRAR